MLDAVARTDTGLRSSSAHVPIRSPAWIITRLSMNPKPTIGTAIVSACLLNWRAVGCGTAEAAAADEDDEEEEEHARLPRRATARAARLSIIYFQQPAADTFWCDF